MAFRPQSSYGLENLPPEEIVRTLIGNEFIQQVAKYVHASEAENARLRKENSTFREKLACGESLPGAAPKVPETFGMVPRSLEKPESRQDVRSKTPLQPFRAWGGQPTATGLHGVGNGDPHSGLHGEGTKEQRKKSKESGCSELVLDDASERPVSSQPETGVVDILHLTEEASENADDQLHSPKSDSDDYNEDGNNEQRKTRKAARSLGMVKRSRKSQAPHVLIEPEHHYSAVHIVHHPYFHKAITVTILVNSFVVGLQINHDAVSNHENLLFPIVEYLSCFVFTAELALHTAALRRKQFEHRADWQWYFFDAILVTFSWVDIILTLAIGDTRGDATGALGPVKKIMKTLRMARIMRILRVVQFLHSLHMMINLVVGSIMNSFWLFVFLIGIIYVNAVVLTDGATQWRKPLVGDPPIDSQHYQDINSSYGTITRSMYTLFMSMTGGVDWGEPADLSWEFGWVYYVVFVLYTFLSVFSVLNIVNGIFVDAAIQKSSNDRYVRLRQNEEAKERYAEGLADQLERFDMDHSGFITKDEWQNALKDKHVVNHMEALEVVVREADDLFSMLDVNDDGMVTISEFQEGMHKLKGSAQSVDLMAVAAKVNHLASDIHKIYDRLDSLHKKADKQTNEFGGLRSAADPLQTFT